MEEEEDNKEDDGTTTIANRKAGKGKEVIVPKSGLMENQKKQNREQKNSERDKDDTADKSRVKKEKE